MSEYREWTLLLTGEHSGLVGEASYKFSGSPDYYERVDVVEKQRIAELERELEMNGAQMAGDSALIRGLKQENERLEGNLREVLANERALIKQLQFERTSRSNIVLEASQRFVDARALLDCSRFYAKSHQNEEYANAERIALNELEAALESSDE